MYALVNIASKYNPIIGFGKLLAVPICEEATLVVAQAGRQERTRLCHFWGKNLKFLRPTSTHQACQ